MNIVLCCEEKILQKLSYEETLSNIKQLELFYHKNIPEKSCIGISMAHNIHIPALILSMKAAGHTFVPMSSNELEEDMQSLVDEANIQYLLSFDNDKIVRNFEFLSSIVLGSDRIILWRNNINRKDCLMKDSPLCILTTSGTTGKRKLIRIESYCIEQNVNSLSKIFNLTEKDVIYFGTPLTFDPSLVELFLALKSRSTLLIVPEKTKLNAERLFRTLFRKTDDNPGITFLQTVPSLFTRWCDKHIQYILKQSSLKHLVLGGEPFPTKILKFDRSIKIYNIYGISEISCWATIHEVKDDNEVFLGNCLEETFAKVCEEGVELQEGIGELFLGSETRFCYVNDEIKKIKWRCTGDLVKKSSQGIKYLGRNDDRIKRLGHQVFPSMIEKKIFDKLELTTKCIWYEKENKLLLFALIPFLNQKNTSKILHELRVKLLTLLSREEFPDFIDLISTFPVTQNGKIDNWTLMKFYEQNKINPKKKQASSIFITILSKYLGHSLQNINKITNFTFEELGGTSLIFILVTNELRDMFKYDLASELISLMLNQTIGTCLNFLSNSEDWKNDKRSSDDKELEQNKKRTKQTNTIQVMWKYDMQGCVDAPPLVFMKDGRTYVGVGSFSNIFVILDATTGESKFVEKFPDSIGSQALLSRCSNFLYFGCFDGNLYCIDLKNYTTAWNYKTNDSIKCKPCLCLNNEALVFGSYDKHIHCISTKAGKLIWKTLIHESMITTPLIIPEKKEILVTTLSSSCISLSEDTGEVLWRIKLRNPIFSSPCIMGNIMRCCDVLGNVYSINLDTKQYIVNTKLESEIYSSMKYIHDFFIIASTEGYLYKLKLEDDVNITVSSLNLGNSISATPDVFVKDHEIFAAVFCSTGDFNLVNLGKMEIVCYGICPGEVFSSCAYSVDKLFVGCRDDHLYCLVVDNT